MTEFTEYLRRNCPVCGSARSSKVVARSKRTAEEMDFPSLVPHWNGFFKEKVYFSYVRCHGCGLVYAPIFFNPHQLEKLYGQMPPNMVEVPLAALRRTQSGYFDTLASCCPLTGGFIEVGPDIGLFTDFCSRKGNFREFWLFEPNCDVKAQLSRTVTGKKYQIIHEMFDFARVPDESASVAVMIHVLDHLINPVQALQELRKKLVSGARLLLVTHDESSLLRRVVGWRWPAFCLQHPQLYSPSTIRNLLAKAGYRVILSRKTTNHFQVGFLVRHLLWAFGFKADFGSGFGQTTIGLKLGNILTVATPAEGDHL